MQILGGLLNPSGGYLHVKKPRSFVFQNPDHQVGITKKCKFWSVHHSVLNFSNLWMADNVWDSCLYFMFVHC